MRSNGLPLVFLTILVFTIVPRSTGIDKAMPTIRAASEPLEYDALPLRSRHRFALLVADRPDGSSLALPVLVMVGQRPTPRLVCVAGVHGDEHEGVTALLELWEELEPEALQGTVVMVPVANPPAFAANARVNPQDPVDMNRVFPGRADGRITERLAYHLFHSVVTGADLVLSMHGWSSGALVLPYVEYPRDSPVTPASRAAARAFGLDTLEPLDWHPGLLCAACNRAGIPAIEPEIGGLGYTEDARRALYKRGTRALMQHLGILPGHAGDYAVPPQGRTARGLCPDGRRHASPRRDRRGGADRRPSCHADRPDRRAGRRRDQPRRRHGVDAAAGGERQPRRLARYRLFTPFMTRQFWRNRRTAHEDHGD